jgi:hypothetical protein
MDNATLTRRLKVPSLTRKAAIIAIIAAVMVGGGSAAAVAATTSQAAPSASGITIVQSDVVVPADSGYEKTLDCPTDQTAFSPGDVPVGGIYNKTAALNGGYITEWSGPTKSYEWDWFFTNVSLSPISITFSVKCMP